VAVREAEIRIQELGMQRRVTSGRAGFRCQVSRVSRSIKIGGGQTGQDVAWVEGRRTKVTSKSDEQRGNVFENKGPLWKTWPRSGNVIENKGSYAAKAGMLLKIKDLVLGARDWGVDQPMQDDQPLPERDSSPSPSLRSGSGSE